jgi:hypothetical protein
MTRGQQVTPAEVYESPGKVRVLKVGEKATTGCPACGMFPFQGALHLKDCPFNPMNMTSKEAAA